MKVTVILHNVLKNTRLYIFSFTINAYVYLNGLEYKIEKNTIKTVQRRSFLLRGFLLLCFFLMNGSYNLCNMHSLEN